MTAHVNTSNTLGTHWVVDYRGCDAELLRDATRIEALLVKAVVAAGATPLERSFHRFEPDGVSGAVLLAESHITIHTWPDKRFAAVDFYTCGDTQPARAHDELIAGLACEDASVVVIRRGLHAEPGEQSSVLVEETGRHT